MSYLVKPGDTLSGIAARNGLTLNDLIRANPQITNPNLIRVGQAINLRGNGVLQHEEIMITAARPDTWVGMAVKVGGQVQPELLQVVRSIVPGFKAIGGDLICSPLMVSLRYPEDIFSFHILDQRTPGFDPTPPMVTEAKSQQPFSVPGGCSMGLSLVVVKGLVTPRLLNGFRYSGSDFGVSLGKAWTPVLKPAFARLKALKWTPQFLLGFLKNPEHMDRRIGWSKFIKDSLQGPVTEAQPSRPSVFIVDVPGTGPSLELSAYNYSGRVHVRYIQLKSEARRG